MPRCQHRVSGLVRHQWYQMCWRRVWSPVPTDQIGTIHRLTPWPGDDIGERSPCPSSQSTSPCKRVTRRSHPFTKTAGVPRSRDDRVVSTCPGDLPWSALLDTTTIPLCPTIGRSAGRRHVASSLAGVIRELSSNSDRSRLLSAIIDNRLVPFIVRSAIRDAEK